MNKRASWSLSCTDDHWSPYERVQYNTVTDSHWKERSFISRPLSASWNAKLRPQIAISRTRLVVAAGTNLNVYAFAKAQSYSDAPVVKLEAIYPIARTDVQEEAHYDISGITFLPDKGEDRTLLTGFADGYVMRITLPDTPNREHSLLPDLETLYIEEDAIESVSAFNDLSFSLSSSGNGVLRNNTSATSSEIIVGEKSWSSFVSKNVSPYVAIGTSSLMALAIYPIYESSLSSEPSVSLSSIRASDASGSAPGTRASAVYGITGTPPSFPGNPGQIVVSGWFDGRVRLYDLRAPSKSTFTAQSATKNVPFLSPVLTLFDPWATESIYAVSTGGGSGHTVAAGASRHSVVAFWDVRAPGAGWSVHAPGNDASPVYTVALESSRLFGATQSRSFVYDFGPGVGVGTYPALPQAVSAATGPRNRRGLDDSLRTSDGLDYMVTKYIHKNPMAGG